MHLTTPEGSKPFPSVIHHPGLCMYTLCYFSIIDTEKQSFSSSLCNYTRNELDLAFLYRSMESSIMMHFCISC